MGLVFSPQNSITKRILSGLLAIWMSGFVLLFCCGTSSARAAEKDSCPLVKKDHCSKSKETEKVSQFETVLDDNSTFDCCGVLPQLLDKVRKVEINRQFAALPATLDITRLSVFPIQSKERNFFEYRPPMLDRSGTYLKNHVFRI